MTRSPLPFSNMNSAAGPDGPGSSRPPSSFRSKWLKSGTRRVGAETPRQPRHQMRLGGADLDRVADLGDIELVRAQAPPARSGRQDRRPLQRPRSCRAPSSRLTPPTRKAKAATAAAIARQLRPERSSVSTFSRAGTGFVRGLAKTQTDRIRLRAPGGDTRRILRMRGEPGLHRSGCAPPAIARRRRRAVRLR